MSLAVAFPIESRLFLHSHSILWEPQLQHYEASSWRCHRRNLRHLHYAVRPINFSHSQLTLQPHSGSLQPGRNFVGLGRGPISVTLIQGCGMMEIK